MWEVKHIELILEILKYVIVAAVFGLGGYLIRKRLAEAVIGSAEEEAKLCRKQKDAEAMKRRPSKLRKKSIARVDQELKEERRSELQQLERRLVQKKNPGP